MKCALILVQSKLSISRAVEKREPSLTLSGSEEKLTQIDLKQIGVYDPTCSPCVDASIEWQFYNHEYINKLLKPTLKLGKARLP